MVAHTLILTFGRKRQEDHGEFKASLGYLVRPCIKKKKFVGEPRDALSCSV